MGLNPENLTIRYEAIIEYRGQPIMDSRLAELLRLIDETGSLLKASHRLGIPYSRAWELIMKTERILGSRLIESFKGGWRRGGTRLTETARRLLEIYDKALRSLKASTGYTGVRSISSSVEPELIIAYSHDPLLEIIIGKLEMRGVRIDGLCIGSGLSLATLSLEESDIACIHLFDPETGEYNKPYLAKYWLKDRVVFLGGYERELVFALRPGLGINSLDELLSGIIKGRLRIVNRNRGSGTRVYLDYLLEKYSGGRINVEAVRGYNNVVYTHLEAAKQVAMGKADTGLMLRYAAEMYGLKHIHVTWERYECITLKNNLYKKPVREFIEVVNTNEIRELIKNTPGYRLL